MMTNGFLDPDQKRQLEDILASESEERWRGYAHLILLYDEGYLTHQISQIVHLSRSRVRHWRRQFQAKGLAIFPPDILNSSAKSTLGVAALSATTTDEAQSTQLAHKPEPKVSSRAKLNSLEAFIQNAKKYKSPGVLPEDPIAEAGRKVLRYHFAQMLLHEDGTRLGEDIEELHDMRVATRRMRAAMEVFGDAFEPKAIKPHLKGLRNTGRSLGKVRDLDVFLEKANKYLNDQPADHRQGLYPLMGAWEGQRELARTEMLSYFDSDKYQVFKESFFDFLSTPGTGARALPSDTPAPNLVNEIVPVLIYTRLGSVRSFDTILGNATIQQLHALRIEFKKLRYTVEFFREVLGDSTKTVIDDIKVMQDHLGDLNDAQVATEILRDFLTQWDTHQLGKPLQERESHQPIMAYLSYQYEQRHRLLKTFQDKWEYFNRPEFRQELAATISVL